MDPAPNLKDLDASKPLTEQALIQNSLDDKGQYKKLQDKDNRLIEHVRAHCQNS